jgi:hypothetical protein
MEDAYDCVEEHTSNQRSDTSRTRNLVMSFVWRCIIRSCLLELFGNVVVMLFSLFHKFVFVFVPCSMCFLWFVVSFFVVGNNN